MLLFPDASIRNADWPKRRSRNVRGPQAGREADWDEDEHPRHPAGDEQGGEFAPKGEGGADTRTTSPRERLNELVYHTLWAPAAIGTKISQDDYIKRLDQFRKEFNPDMPISVPSEEAAKRWDSDVDVGRAMAIADASLAIAELPPFVRDHLVGQGWRMEIGGQGSTFTVGNKTFERAGYADSQYRVIGIDRSGSQSSGPIDTSLLAHEAGHAAVDLLARRFLATQVDPKAEFTFLYDAWLRFDTATREEGGITSYSDAYVTTEKSSGQGSAWDEWRVRDPVHRLDYHNFSTPRSVNENFAEFFRLYLDATTSRRLYKSQQDFWRVTRGPLIPDTDRHRYDKSVDAFRYLLELLEKNPRDKKQKPLDAGVEVTRRAYSSRR